jgi:pyruvate/2-oxoglutarate dehydrogenase complex dihydrolipoamide acyltransferase (E2) component
MPKDFRLPDLGEGVHEGQVVRVHVQEGDVVREDDPLLEVETDKAAVEIPSPHSGIVSRVHVAAQQMVNVGDVMVTFGEADEEVAAAAAPAAKDAPGAMAGPASAPASQPTSAPYTPPQTGPMPAPGSGRGPKPASPAVRKLARQLSVDLQTIDGSGPGGRVTRSDVERAAAAPVPTAPAETSSKPRRAPAPAVPTITPGGVEGRDQHGPVLREPLTQARQTIARVMTQSWTTIPHVTDTHEADITDLERLRRGHEPSRPDDPRLTSLAFVLRAVVRALQRYPRFNASFDEEAGEIVYRRYMNIAVGVHTERGLIAPVIRDADRLGVLELAKELGRIAEKARTASFEVNDTRGGTYTISNPGALGGSRFSTPLITPPQAAVLGLGRSRWRPWVVDEQIVPRLILPLSHSFDHRLIDGGDELAFMNHLVEDLESPARLVLG